VSPAVLEHDADLADAEIVEPRLRDRIREHMVGARASTARCSCGGTPTRDEDGGSWTCVACGKPARAPSIDLPAGLRAAIVRAVADAGGDADDARDLAEVWARALRDSERHTAAMLTANRLRACNCADGADHDGRGRCFRCNLATGAAA
jgi:hypothetical protein